MKKIILIVSLILFLTACDNQKNDEDTDLSQTQEELEQEKNEIVEDQEIIKENQKVEKESENIEVKKEDAEDQKEKNYDDLSFIDCYKDILNSDLPLKDYISPDTNSHIVTYLNDDTYVDNQYFKTTYQHGSYYFNLIDHKDFDYPLLVLKEKSNMFTSIVIIQYLGDGKYNTMGYMGGSEISFQPENLYFDDSGNLFVDSSYYEDEIYGVNKVGDKLMINYAYTTEGKGPASKRFADYYVDPPIEKIDENYPDGVDEFDRVMIFDDEREDFSYEKLERLRDNLHPIDLIDLSIEKYNEIAKESFANKKNIAVGPKTSGSSIEDKDSYSKMLNFIRENLYVSQPAGKEEEVYIADYDNNGKLAAYVVAMDKSYKPMLIFVDEDLNIRKVKDLVGGEGGFGYYKVLNDGIFEAGNDQFIAIEENYGSSKSDCYIYSVKDNEVYEPEISGKVSYFIKDEDTFINKFYYHEYNEKGGVLKEATELYRYYQVDRQFENISEPSNGDEVDFSKETNEGPQRDEYVDPNADDANSAKDDYIDFNGPDKKPEDKIEDNKEEKQVVKEQNKRSNENESSLIKNVTDIRPEIRFLGPTDKKFYLGVVNYNDYPKTAKILVKGRDFSEIAKDGYLIHDADHEIGVKTNILIDRGLMDMPDDKTYTFTVQVVDGKVKSKEYTYFYNNKLSKQLKEIYSDSLIQNSKIGDKLDSLLSKSKKMQGKYYFIEPISKTADYNAVETELRNKWFAYADTISYNNILDKLEIAKDAKYTKSDLKSLYKASPAFRDISLAKKILDNIKGKTIIRKEEIDGRKYKFYYEIISASTVSQIKGRVEDKNGNEILNEIDLIANPKLNKNALRLNEEYMRNVGLQVLSSAMNLNEQVNGGNKYTKKANDFSQSEDLKLVDRSDLSYAIGKINKFYDYFDDKTLNSSKRRKLVSESFDLYKKGTDFFSMCESLNNIIKLNPKSKASSNTGIDENSCFNVDGSDINKYIKDCDVVYKYFTKEDDEKENAIINKIKSFIFSGEKN